MELQQFHLKWDNHYSNLVEGFLEILNNEQLCDVTIACDGMSVKAHKLILSASSSFFRNIFLENPCTHPVIILPELKYNDVKALIDFMYYGQVNVCQTQLSSILKAAKSLKIKGISEQFLHHNNIMSEELTDEVLSVTTSLPLSSQENPNSTNSLTSTMDEVNFHHADTTPCAMETRVPFSAHSESDNMCSKSSLVKHELQADENNSLDDSNCVLSTPMEINPSSLMEQTMTTENIFQTKHLTENPIESNSMTFDDSNGTYSQVGNLDQNDVQSSDAYFSQEMQGSNDSSNQVSEKSLLKLPLMCSNCKYIMTTLSDAQSHLNTNPNCRTSQFKCPLCPKIFIWPATLVKHFREQHQGPDGTTRVTERLWYYCDVCRKPLLSKHALTLHRNKFHGHLADPFQPASPESTNPSKRGRKQGTRVCRLCKRTFLSSGDYHTHIQNFHCVSNASSSMYGSTFDSRDPISAMENESNSSQSVMSISSIT